MTEYRCMTPDELAAWTDAARVVQGGVLRPCYDCPAWFATAAREAGCCDRKAQRNGRPMMTAEERADAARERRRRRKVAQASRRYRAKLRSEVEAVRAARPS